MKLLFLLTLVLGGFSLPAHASKQLDICADHKYMKSNSGMLIIRRLDTGEIADRAPDTSSGRNRTYMDEKFEEYCSDR